MPFPASPRDLTAAWLSEALSSSVVAFELAPLAAQGATSETLRIRLHYAPGADGPASLIAKFPGPTPAMREVGRESGAYRIETWFYRYLATTQEALPVPACYFASFDRPTGNFLLLLEDLTGWEPGDLFSSDLPRIRRMLTALAAIHAANWERAAANERWLSRFTGPALGSIARLLTQAIPTCRVRWPEFTGSLETVSAAIAANPAIYGRLGALPRTLVHGDFHLQNALFSPDGDDCRVIDWATCFAGPAVADISRLLTTCLAPGLRRTHEPDLLAHYHRALVANGVTSYSLAQLRDDYPLGLLSSVVVNTLALAGFGENPWLERTRETGITPAELLGARLSIALADHDVPARIAS
ncbi:MAG: phosphotransferase [Tepidiformaceae bacterium]